VARRSLATNDRGPARGSPRRPNPRAAAPGACPGDGGPAIHGNRRSAGAPARVRGLRRSLAPSHAPSPFATAPRTTSPDSWASAPRSPARGPEACRPGAGGGARIGPEAAPRSDEELGLDEELRRVARRDEAALERLYRRTHTAPFRRLLRMLPDRSRAETALVDTFVRVWDKAGQFDGRLGSAWS